MTFKQIKMAIYATLLTNSFGYKLKKAVQHAQKKQLRIDYAQRILAKLGIEVTVTYKERLPKNGQFLLVSNHKSVIDPLIIEVALKDTEIFGIWISKIELANSLFFGSFVKNAGTILLDRESKNMSDLFKQIKSSVAEGDSIFIFPEGTRNKEKTELSDFKSGTKLIALKNRLPLLPVYIRTDAQAVLQASLHNRREASEIVIEIGEIIDYKDKADIEEAYRKMFGLVEKT